MFICEVLQSTGKVGVRPEEGNEVLELAYKCHLSTKEETHVLWYTMLIPPHCHPASSSCAASL
jgi:hypothetical protein